VKLRPFTTLPVCSALSQYFLVVCGRVAITLPFFGALLDFISFSVVPTCVQTDKQACQSSIGRTRECYTISQAVAIDIVR